MKREEFIKNLDYLLSDIQDSEREEALQYYNDYFDEAGADSEEDVVQELGSPEKVAAIIKMSLNENVSNENGEYSECGYEDPRFERVYEVSNDVKNKQDNNYSNDRTNNPGNEYNQYDNNKYENRSSSYKRTYTKRANGGQIALIIILAIIAIPVLGPIAIGALGLVFGLIAGFFGILVGLFCATIGLVVTGIAVFVVGIIKLFTMPLVGILAIGGGLVTLGIGILFGLLFVLICTKLLPALLRGIVYLFKIPFRNRGNVA